MQFPPVEEIREGDECEHLPNRSTAYTMVEPDPIPRRWLFYKT